uniref:Protein kinase domain-containing protein n=1 Tax=Chromera velia CCMP2878 TaxID=1169474 RepID=A0A0G4HEF1_9ALVE|eukprot:Cvel_6551.t1-p1 / transcript=Cvel_6551.t1 / gene=Cvel_6551 / organism=Chromera_velia_CCMP2878 / gene_product=hypothetical protein / transcript_product=hypothetical protein / location=Cvel_scaffold322:73288-78081(-) / protein_length=279 / sequence_SO=supercontig / SO=protein_coding / is_pseudo=false
MDLGSIGGAKGGRCIHAPCTNEPSNAAGLLWAGRAQPGGDGGRFRGGDRPQGGARRGYESTQSDVSRTPSCAWSPLSHNRPRARPFLPARNKKGFRLSLFLCDVLVLLQNMAPEVFAGNVYDLSCDLWGLGHVFVYVCTGEENLGASPPGEVSVTARGAPADLSWGRIERKQMLIKGLFVKHPRTVAAALQGPVRGLLGEASDPGLDDKRQQASLEAAFCLVTCVCTSRADGLRMTQHTRFDVDLFPAEPADFTEVIRREITLRLGAGVVGGQKDRGEF